MNTRPDRRTLTLRPNTLSSLLLGACLGFGAMAAQAQATTPAGFTAEAQDQGRVRVGMSQAEVLAALGTPAGKDFYRLSESSTWRYRVPAAGNLIEFQVDFGQDGKVRSARQVILPAG